MPNPGEVTLLLQRADEGDVDAADELFRMVEQDLKKIAARRKQALPQVRYSTMGLVDEVFCKLVGQQQTEWQAGDRRKFYGYASRKMHDLLIDAAKKASAVKHGGGVNHVELDEQRVQAGDQNPQEALDLLMDLNTALQRFEEECSAEDANVFRIRYFFDSTFAEIADVIETTEKRAQLAYRIFKNIMQ